MTVTSVPAAPSGHRPTVDIRILEETVRCPCFLRDSSKTGASVPRRHFYFWMALMWFRQMAVSTLNVLGWVLLLFGLAMIGLLLTIAAALSQIRSQ